MANIKVTDMAKMLRLTGPAIDWAMANTLNTIAFDSVKEGIPRQAEKDLNFTKPSTKRQALGFRVEKAHPNNKPLQAIIGSTRGWLANHLSEGTRTPSAGGWEFNNQKFIFIPYELKAFSRVRRRLRLKAKYRKGLVVIPDGSGALVFYAPKTRRGTRASKVLLGFLVNRAKYHRDFHFEKPIEDKVRKDSARLLKWNLNRQHQMLKNKR